MNKYNIEGGIDFYAELYKSLDNDNGPEENSNICLITNQPLIDKYVTMECGHKFNYIPLYKDILNHKQKFNGLEGSQGKLDIKQIRCPYCREKQDILLPYYEELGLAKVNGINFYDPNIKSTSYHQDKGEKCMYKHLNENFDPNEPETNKNKKYIECPYHFATKIKIPGKIIMPGNIIQSQYITYGDDNYYCYSHKKLMTKYYKKQETIAQKALLKSIKQKEKANAKAAKELEKQKEKEEKQKAKEMLKNQKNLLNENVVIGPSTIETDIQFANGCVAIIKSGPNKGKYCGCQIKADNMCGRHYKLVNGIIMNN